MESGKINNKPGKALVYSSGVAAVTATLHLFKPKKNCSYKRLFRKYSCNEIIFRRNTNENY